MCVCCGWWKEDNDNTFIYNVQKILDKKPYFLKTFIQFARNTEILIRKHYPLWIPNKFTRNNCNTQLSHRAKQRILNFPNENINPLFPFPSRKRLCYRNLRKILCSSVVTYKNTYSLWNLGLIYADGYVVMHLDNKVSNTILSMEHRWNEVSMRRILESIFHHNQILKNCYYKQK